MARRPVGRVGRWLRIAGLAVLVLVAIGVMLRLSLWQWDRAQERHSVLNYFYAVEWGIFALLTVAGIARLVVEGRRAVTGREEVEPAPRADGVLVGPPLRPGEELQEVTWVRLRRWLRLERPAEHAGQS